MQFAFETIIWGRRIHDLELVLDIVAACGYRGIELAQAPDEVFIRDTSAPTGSRKLANIQELLTLLAARGLTLVGLAGGSLNNRMRFCGEFRGCFLYVEDFGDAEKRAVGGERPFRLGLHPHWLMKVQRIAQAKRRFEEYRNKFPNRNDLLLLPDTAHLTIANDDPISAIAEFFGQLAAVHLKDWTPAYGRYSHRYSQGFVTLGEGVVKLHEVIRLLEENNYDGWVVIEQDSADPTIAESALRCAEWLHSQGYMAKPDRARLEGVAAREQTISEARPEAELVGEARLLERLIPATIRGPASFYQTVVKSFHELYGLDAAKLYSYFPQNDELHLLAIHGMEDHRCQPVLSASKCFFRDVILDQHVSEFDLEDRRVRDEFEDKPFLRGLRARRMISVPIFNPTNTHHLRYVLNLFPLEGGSGLLTPSTGALEKLGMMVSDLADHMTDDICAVIATKANIECGGVRTCDELIEKMLKFLMTSLRAEAASIFLVDESGERLTIDETRWSTGIEWNSKRDQNQHFYRKGEGLTGAIWEQRTMRVLADVQYLRYTDAISWEQRASQNRDECILAPVYVAGSEVLGVVRLVNKQRVPRSRSATMFTVEDMAILDSIIQVMASHLQILTLQERQSSALIRMTHEFQVPLVAIRNAVDMLRHRLREASLVDVTKQDLLDDIQSWALLMGRLASNAKLFATTPNDVQTRQTRTRTQLLTDVIAPAVKHVDLLLREKEFSKTEIVCGEFDGIPELWVDRSHFQQVFFNLLSNAIKYSGSELRVVTEGKSEGGEFVVSFSDWGIGVPNGLEENIFLPGFRAQQARQSNVTGQGIGLFVVRNIILAHGGNIVLRRNKAPTVFEIRLPNTLRFPSHQGSE